MIGQLKDMNQLLSELLTAWDRDTASADGENEVEVCAEEVGEEAGEEEVKDDEEQLPEEGVAEETRRRRLSRRKRRM